jgi:hypothetical protein
MQIAIPKGFNSLIENIILFKKYLKGDIKNIDAINPQHFQ